MVNYGIINLHKPVGPTSRDCVNRIARRLPEDKVAHAGTLDPLASGVLVLLIGPAVRLMDDVHHHDKEYVARFRLGVESPSLDCETEGREVPIPSGIDGQRIQNVLKNFLGRIAQTPPAYSAIRVDGRRAHEVARSGLAVAIPPREVHVHGIELLELALPDFALRISCSTGTYIRTLGNDIARSLGTSAIMTDLLRTRVGPFAIEDSVTLKSLEPGVPEHVLLPATHGIAHLPQWTVSDAIMRRFLDGQKLSVDDFIESVEGNATLGHPLEDGSHRAGLLDTRGFLRVIVRSMPDGRWRCEKGIAHWDIFP